MSSRSYLSIGDVLTLLRQEFPDVTISKIRFLESQGLVNPERTPSGYRKFYEHDVERLRWVLRQQREHFLPLKVIKDRLDEDGTTDAGRTPAPATAVIDGQPDAPVPPAADDATVLVGHGAATTDHAVASGSGLPGLGSPARRRAPARIGAAVPSKPAPAASTTPPVERAHRASMATPATQDPPATHAGETSAAHGMANGSGASGRSGATGGTAPSASPAAPAHAPAAAEGDGKGRGGKGSRTPAPAAPPAGGSLSMEDLCKASGLRPEDIVELQEFGLLAATTAAGVEFFDEEALAVAELAAKFAGFGVEARHLRLYKNAADREAGFIEQIVIPMVRQRNPEARARAAQTAEELSDLGRQLKASLLRTALRDIL